MPVGAADQESDVCSKIRHASAPAAGQSLRCPAPCRGDRAPPSAIWPERRPAAARLRAGSSAAAAACASPPARAARAASGCGRRSVRRDRVRVRGRRGRYRRSAVSRGLLDAARTDRLGRLGLDRGLGLERPHLLQLVEGARLGAEDVDDHVARIDQHPVADLLALDRDDSRGRPASAGRRDARRSPHLARRAARGDHHVVGECRFALRSMTTTSSALSSSSEWRTSASSASASWLRSGSWRPRADEFWSVMVCSFRFASARRARRGSPWRSGCRAGSGRSTRPAAGRRQARAPGRRLSGNARRRAGLPRPAPDSSSPAGRRRRWGWRRRARASRASGELRQIVGAHQPDEARPRKARLQRAQRVGGIARAEPRLERRRPGCADGGADLRARAASAVGERRHAGTGFSGFCGETSHHTSSSPSRFSASRLMMAMAVMGGVERAAEQPDAAAPRSPAWRRPEPRRQPARAARLDRAGRMRSGAHLAAAAHEVSCRS